MEVKYGGCFICWKTFEGTKLFHCSSKSLQCYSKYLESVPFDEGDLSSHLPLLCSTCLATLEILSEISDELDLVQIRLNDSVKSFTLEILKCRNILAKNVPDENDDNSWKSREISMGIGSHFIIPSFGDVQQPTLLQHNYDDYYEDSFTNTNSVFSDTVGDFLDVEISEPVENSQNTIGGSFKTTPAKGATNVPKRDLLVVIERLRFDSMGKPILPKKIKAGPAWYKRSKRLNTVKLGKPTALSSKPGPAISKNRRKAPPLKLVAKPRIGSVQMSAKVVTGPRRKQTIVPQKDTESTLGSKSGKDEDRPEGVSEKSKTVRRKVVVVKKYLCRYAGCEKSYANEKHLREHCKGHIGDSFVCSWPNCGRPFQRSDKLTRHYRLHTGEKPYQCSVCLQSFSRSDYVPRHMKTHHSQLYYQQSIQHIN